MNNRACHNLSYAAGRLQNAIPGNNVCHKIVAYCQAPFLHLIKNYFMNKWKNILTNLSTAGKFLASWQLESGVTFFMFIPAVEAMAVETLTEESDIRFEDIVSIEILKKLQLGGLWFSNDLTACRLAIERMSEVNVVDVVGGLRIIIG